MQSFEELWYDVHDYKLELYLKYHQLEKGMKHANGCGSKGGVKFPDTMYFVSIISACTIHDIEWELAKCYQDLLDSNGRFNRNLKRITDKESNSIMAWLRRMRIAKYVAGVELIGTDAYAKERGFINE